MVRQQSRGRGFNTASCHYNPALVHILPQTHAHTCISHAKHLLSSGAILAQQILHRAHGLLGLFSGGGLCLLASLAAAGGGSGRRQLANHAEQRVGAA